MAASPPPPRMDPASVSENCHLLYHHVVIPSQQVLHAVEGSFTLPNAHDMVVVRHRSLELWTLHAETGKVECIHSMPLMTDVYAAVAVPTGVAVQTGSHRKHSSRSGTSSKLGGSGGVQRDGVHYLAVTSESGYVTLLRYELTDPPMPTRVAPLDLTSGTGEADGEAERQAGSATVVTTSLRGSFVKVSEVLLGRSGARVTVPGMRMTVDDNGTALFITAFMRCKVVVPIRKTNIDASQLTLEDLEGTAGGDGGDEDEDESDVEEEEEENANLPAISRKRKRLEKGSKGGVIVFGSPIEVHRHTVIYAVCAIEGSAETALFAALEEEIVEAKRDEVARANPTGSSSTSTVPSKSEGSAGGAFLKAPGVGGGSARRKTLVVYAYVASLKQVQRTHLIYPPPTAHRLISLPAAPAGPGGVLVCTDTEVIWYDLSTTASADAGASAGRSTGIFKCPAPFPRRVDVLETNYDPSIIAHALTVVSGDYFLLLQDEHGDMYRVSISAVGVHAAKNAYKIQKDSGQAPAVKNPLSIHYYETIPPAKTMVLFRKGFLFVASDGDAQHCLFRVKEGYTSESEYVVKRMKTSTRGGGVAALDGGRMGMPNLLPPSSGAPLGRALGTSGGPSGLLPPPPSSVAAPGTTRTIATFLPHSAVKHLDILQHFPNTPPIGTLCATIPSTRQYGDDQQQESQQAVAQQQVQLTSVCGRGATSVLTQAQYGYSTQQLKRVILPTVFAQMIPLCSAGALHRYRMLQQEVVQEAQRRAQHHGGDGSRRHGGSSTHRNTAIAAAAANKALRQLATVASQFGVGTDRVVLSTLQGTTVFTIGVRVEHDTLSGFESAERTLSASTLEDGRGYFQVTPRGLYVIPPPADSPPALQEVAVEATAWHHPSGKVITAASTTPTSAILAFSGGGIASFHFGHTGTQLVQWDNVPAFPTSTAISLLQPPASAFSAAMHRELSAILFQHHTSSSSGSRERLSMDLAAIATTSKEVHLVDPSNLRKPLEIIRHLQDGGRGDIRSVLLTYLDENPDNGIAALRGRRRSQRRLFCFIGFTDGRLVRCELDPFSIKVVERQELSCGTKPCHLIPGDSETVCYIQSGEQCWRCGIRSGVPKIMPWRFPTRQNTFAYFAIPRRPASMPKKEPGDNESRDNDGDGDDDGAAITLRSTSRTEESVLALRDRELLLFSAQQISSLSLEYSLSAHPLQLGGRRLVQHCTNSSYFLIGETEHRGFSGPTVQRRHQEGKGIFVLGRKRSLNKPNQYNSALQLFHQESGTVLPPVYMNEGDAVMSLTMGRFLTHMGKEPIVVVGVARHFSHGEHFGGAPTWRDGLLRAYHFVPGRQTGMMDMDHEGRAHLTLELLHQTFIADAATTTTAGLDAAPEPDYPSALCVCEEVGLLLVGLGARNGLRIYAFGRSQFLRKRHLPNVPARINAIEVVFSTPPSTAAAKSYNVSGLYECATEHRALAREKQMLIVCGTVSDSIFIASLQPGSQNSLPGFLMMIARDPVPRHLTCMTVIDETTFAVADRFGTVAFLRLPSNIRTGFAEPIDKLTEAELNVVIQDFAARQQFLEEIAVHHPGELVTSMQTLEYNPSGGEDPTLNTRVVFYGTALGSVGCYTPFVDEEDGALSAYLRPLLRQHMRVLLQPCTGQLPFYYHQNRGRGHHVVEGEWLEIYRQSPSAAFPADVKEEVEEALERVKRVEAARRSRLGLPPRVLPSVEDLVAKQRALATLPL